WLSKVHAWKSEFPLVQVEEHDEFITPQYVIETLDELLGEKAIITTEVGQHQMWAAQFYNFRSPRSFITSGGLGTMGYGLGASLGAQVANPDRQVVNIAGDGSFHMNCNELVTASKYNIPIIELIFNNNVLGMVRQWQRLFYSKRFSHTTLDRPTDYIKLAQAFGINAYVIEKKSQVKTVLQKAVKSKSPVLIDCRIDKDINVLPMVPAGKSVEDIILEIED
ncbi:MAG: acetolactate synthase large subunit, partial [Clostridiales bacterium]|nr:acetolactate synthase large subunit [Clostridiales bacterium]